MITLPHEPFTLDSKRWQAVRLGLNLANSYVGAAVIGWFYALWCLIGLVLCLVFIPFVILGRTEVFQAWLNPIGLYGYLAPLALAGAATWGVKLFARFLWCAIPGPLLAKVLAIAGVVGRLSMLVAVGYLWLRGGPFPKSLLAPEPIACAAIAWLGLVAEWSLLRILRRYFLPAAGAANPLTEPSDGEEVAAEAEETSRQPAKGILTRNVGEWFQSRFPTGHRIFIWLVMPLAYVAISALASDGNPRALPEAFLRMAVVAPALLQTFWIPGSSPL